MAVRSPSLRVAFDCQEDWSTFTGDGASRLCDRCVKQVHDLSTMTRSEATRLLAEPDVCVRFIHDGEGRLLFRSERKRGRLVWQRFVPPG